MNISLKFSDGVEWLARIHRVGFVTSDPRHIARIITQGEIDILRWLKYVAVAPVAEVKSDILCEFPSSSFAILDIMLLLQEWLLTMM